MSLPNDEAADALLDRGILCNWWRNVGTIDPVGQRSMLTPRNLAWHLSRYDDTDPFTGQPFRDNTPYISTTAGTFERDARAARNLARPALLTALWFATNRFRSIGYVFHAYVFTLGRKGVPLVEFAEETRELHIYTRFQRYHPEGELVAKIELPSVRIEKWERYDGTRVRRALAARRRGGTFGPILPDETRPNPQYQSPAQFTNYRRVTI